MKNWLKKTWHDPVWSKVIAGAILAIGGVLYSFAKGLIKNGESIPKAFGEVFGWKVNVWIALVIVLVVLIIISLVRRKKDDPDKAPVTPFVDGFVEATYQGYRWKWRWQWNKENRLYDLTDLNLVCPQCNDGLLYMGHYDYSCGKCGARIPFRAMNAKHGAVATQILADARKRFSYCAEYVGEYK